MDEPTSIRRCLSFVICYRNQTSILIQVFDFCVDQLGRDHVILIANVEEIRQKHRQASVTGVPTFSDQFSNEENKRKASDE
jgi:hypothetical protein